MILSRQIIYIIFT